MIFSVTCKDSTVFKQKYATNTSVLYHYQATNTFRIKTRYAVAKAMAADANVIFVDIQQMPRTEAGTDYADQAYNRIEKAHRVFPGLRGESISVSIKEQRFDTADIDLADRSFETRLASSTMSQHATTMATLIAGGENTAPTGKGVAPAARITSANFENLLPDPDAIFTGYNIRLQNHSYGVDIENYYGNEAAAYDRQMTANPELMHLFSVGNLGAQSPDHGIYSSMNLANLSGNFKQAKNPLTINAVDTTLTVNILNSRGPAYDGRLKPELTAFGQDGTSDACALATGIAALLQEAYYQVHNFHPSAAILKAVLIASADDAGPKGIDFTYGYGSINTYQALQTIYAQQTRMVTLDSRQQRSIPIAVPPQTTTLQIAVTWADPAAQPGSPQALVNNVDAYLSRAGNTWYPWVLSSYPHADSLAASAGRKKDSLNTVEYITLTAPPEGQYDLVITAPVLTTSQPVAIAYWWEKETTFEWDYPVAEEALQSGKNIKLFWKGNSTLPGTLSLQLNHEDWNVVKRNVLLQAPFSWQVPDTLGIARLKMTVGAEDFISDEFTISPQPRMKVAFHCDSDFALTWNPVRGAQQYELYTMGERYLEKLLTTADTLAILPKTSRTKFFAVAPVLGNTTFLKSQTIDYTLQGVQCYINLFEATRSDAAQVKIQLDLSTVVNIDHITIYKTTGQQQVFASHVPDRSINFQWYDDQLIAGAMQYQAEIVLQDGTVILSAPSTINIETKGKAILFPNPVPPGEPLTILSEGAGFTITIFDTMGSAVHSQKLQDVLDVINLPALRPGLYLYQFQDPAGKVVYGGKFIRR
ncbi:S8 family peptidase [Fulvivirgaceae bacterium PWU5]|uniref:S8 family peptidase n=1 Tax=Dawidia cretensis TaxID=2782350 RepID=A0AAP2DZF8_9BACT|nr:S8 family peptidase [Dawidia cretensis]MBT1710020.1 S8 family peptidase [Dawidia cretensis]